MLVERMEKKVEGLKQKRTCDFCQESFILKRKKKDRPGKFCSYDCYWASIKKVRVERICLSCGKLLLLAPFEVRKGTKFCSQECYHLSKKGLKMPEGCIRKGEDNFNWKGGIINQKNGYVLILTKYHPSGQKYVLQHRLVMEAQIGRFLGSKEQVHHINENKKDNRIENLMLFRSNSEHRRYHGRKQREAREESK